MTQPEVDALFHSCTDPRQADALQARLDMAEAFGVWPVEQETEQDAEMPFPSLLALFVPDDTLWWLALLLLGLLGLAAGVEVWTAGEWVCDVARGLI